MHRATRFFERKLGPTRLLMLLFVASAVLALAEQAPAARILRVDPRAARDNGAPILTTVIEVAQSKRLSEAVAHCARARGNAQLDCMSQALEKPYALYTPFPFPEKHAAFAVAIDGTDVPAEELRPALARRLEVDEQAL